MKLILLLLTAICVATPVSAVSTFDSDTLYNVDVLPVSFEQILDADSQHLDQLLYPSGMELPTKYQDIMMFAEYNAPVAVYGDTLNFLHENFQTEGDKYTFAEIQTAQMYLAVHDWSTDRNSVVYKQLPDELSSAEQSVIIEDVAKLRSYLNPLRNLLRGVDPEAEQSREVLPEYAYITELTPGGFYLSMGDQFSWDKSLGMNYIDGFTQRISSFLATRLAYMEAVGLRFTDSSRTEPLAFPSVVIVSAESELSQQPIETIGHSNGNYVSEFKSPMSFEISDGNVRTVGLRDIVMVSSIIVVVLAVIVKWIKDIVRRYNDPTRKYRQWW